MPSEGKNSTYLLGLLGGISEIIHRSAWNCAWLAHSELLMLQSFN